jgi:hypothetical protein
MSPDTFDRLVRAGELAVFRVGREGSKRPGVYVRASELARFVAAREAQAAEE